MTKEINMVGPNKDFEAIKKLDENGIEYWEARELMGLLEYNKWENFEKVIEKAKEACQKSQQEVKYHFPDVRKMINIATGTDKEAVREVKDYNLSRYACYLIAQNGDPRKEAIALAQTYFAVQTRKQELHQQEIEDQKRLFIRDEVSKQNKKLMSTAKSSGVRNFGKFNNAGYEGLYGMKVSEIKQKKKIGEDDILDRAGATELAANLFRITQTDDKLNKEQVYGEDKANETHYSVGSEVRKAIKKIGGRMPENLPAEKHIREVKRKNTINSNTKKQTNRDDPKAIPV